MGCLRAVRGLSLDCPRADCPQTVRGLSMDRPPAVRGLSVNYPWAVRGMPVGCRWAVRGLFLPCDVHGASSKRLSMGCPRTVRGLPSVSFPWVVRGLRMDCPFTVRGLSICCPWALRELPWGYYYHGMPLEVHHKDKQCRSPKTICWL